MNRNSALPVFSLASRHSGMLELDAVESGHAVRVLRMKSGEKAIVMDGKGNEYLAEIVSADAKACTLSVLEERFVPARKCSLHIAIAPTKMNERMEWFLEKATETGIESVTPVICSHSERKQVNMERFRKVILSAAKQSRQHWIPVLNEPVSLEKFIGATTPGFIAHCHDLPRQPLKNLLVTEKDTTILIGPEGDFSTAEVENAVASGWSPVTLGDSRLRTETAGLYACMLFNFVNA